MNRRLAPLRLMFMNRRRVSLRLMIMNRGLKLLRLMRPGFKRIGMTGNRYASLA
jgi:hypothetical protein